MGTILEYKGKPYVYPTPPDAEITSPDEVEGSFRNMFHQSPDPTRSALTTTLAQPEPAREVAPDVWATPPSAMTPTQAMTDFDPLTAGVRDQPSTKDLVHGSMKVGLAFIPMAPLHAAAGIAAFTALDHLYSLEDLLPAETSPFIKDLTFVADLVLKGGLIGKGFKFGRAGAEALVGEKLYPGMESLARDLRTNPSQENAFRLVKALKKSKEYLDKRSALTVEEAAKVRRDLAEAGKAPGDQSIQEPGTAPIVEPPKTAEFDSLKRTAEEFKQPTEVEAVNTAKAAEIEAFKEFYRKKDQADELAVKQMAQAGAESRIAEAELLSPDGQPLPYERPVKAPKEMLSSKNKGSKQKKAKQAKTEQVRDTEPQDITREYTPEDVTLDAIIKREKHLREKRKWKPDKIAQDPEIVKLRQELENTTGETLQELSKRARTAVPTVTPEAAWDSIRVDSIKAVESKSIEQLDTTLDTTRSLLRKYEAMDFETSADYGQYMDQVTGLLEVLNRERKNLAKVAEEPTVIESTHPASGKLPGQRREELEFLIKDSKTELERLLVEPEVDMELVEATRETISFAEKELKSLPESKIEFTAEEIIPELMEEFGLTYEGEVHGLHYFNLGKNTLASKELTREIIKAKVDKIKSYPRNQEKTAPEKVIIEEPPETYEQSPIPEGKVRLYRAESPTVKFEDVFDAEKLANFSAEFDRPKGAKGKRFTSDLSYAEYFKRSLGDDAKITHIDVDPAILRDVPRSDDAFFIETKPAKETVLKRKKASDEVIDEYPKNKKKAESAGGTKTQEKIMGEVNSFFGKEKVRTPELEKELKAKGFSDKEIDEAFGDAKPAKETILKRKKDEVKDESVGESVEVTNDVLQDAGFTASEIRDKDTKWGISDQRKQQALEGWLYDGGDFKVATQEVITGREKWVAHAQKKLAEAKEILNGLSDEEFLAGGYRERILGSDSRAVTKEDVIKQLEWKIGDSQRHLARALRQLDKANNVKQSVEPISDYITIGNAEGQPFGAQSHAHFWMRHKGLNGEVVQDPVSGNWLITGKKSELMKGDSGVAEAITKAAKAFFDDETGAMNVDVFLAPATETVKLLKRVKRKLKGRVISNYYTNEVDLLENLMFLHTEGKIDADLTYSKGAMWKGLKTSPRLKFDIKPVTEDTIQADVSKEIPVPDGSLKSVMFDPPYQITGNRKSKGLVVNRFSGYKNIDHLFDTYNNTIKNVFDKLEPGGVLVVKVQDITPHKNRSVWASDELYATAILAGFKQLDKFHLNRPGGWGLSKTARGNQTVGKKDIVDFRVFQKPVRSYKHPEASVLNSLSVLDNALDALRNERGGIPVDARAIRESLASKRESLRNVFRNAEDIFAKSYKHVFELVDNLRKHTNKTVVRANNFQEDIWRNLPKKEMRERVTHWLDSKTGWDQMSRTEQATAVVLDDLFSTYKERLNAAGILEQFWDDYAPHVILKGPKGTEIPTDAKTSYVKGRVVDKSGNFFDIKALEDKGFVLEKDIATLVAQYVFNAERSIARKHFARAMFDAKTDSGLPVLMPSSKVKFDRKRGVHMFEGEVYRPLTGQSQLKSWAKFSGDRVKSKRTQQFIKSSELMVHKDAYLQTDNLFSERLDPTSRFVGRVRAGVKRLRMYNPLIHGLNVESNVIMGMGFFDYATKRFKRHTPEELKALELHMTEMGVETMNLFDLTQRLGQDVLSFNAGQKITLDRLHENPELILSAPVRTIRDLSDRLLWDKWIKHGQMILFDRLEGKFLKDGLSPKDAGEAAAYMTNDLVGSLPMNWFTKHQRRRLNMLLFARNWTVSNLRTLTGMVPAVAKSKYTPKPLRFEGLSNAQLRMMGKEYRKVVARGFIGSLVVGNLFQAALLKASGEEFHPTWENERGHELDVDLGVNAANGDRMYMKQYLFRQINDYVKLAKDVGDTGIPIRFMSDKMEPMLKIIIDVMKNADYAGEDIIMQGMDVGEKSRALGSYLSRGVFPYEGFIDRKDEIKSWTEILVPLTGTWISRGVGTNAVTGNMLRDFFDYQAEIKYENYKLNTEVSKLLQRGETEKAVNLAIEAIKVGNIGPRSFLNATRKIHNPILHRILQTGGMNFSKFLQSLPPEKKAEYLQGIKGELNKEF